MQHSWSYNKITCLASIFYKLDLKNKMPVEILYNLRLSELHRGFSWNVLIVFILMPSKVEIF